MKERTIRYENVVNFLRTLNDKDERFNFFLNACKAEEFDLCEACLDAGMDINDYYISEGNSLQCLIIYRNVTIETAEWLINKGLNINFEYCGNTALNMACEYNNLEIAKYLIKKGAKITKFSKDKCKHVITDLELAFFTENVEFINLILESGSYTKNELTKELGGLNRAVLDGRYEVAKLYLEFSRKYNLFPDFYDKQGRMAIHIAVFHSDEKMLKLLLENNANPNAKIRSGSWYDKNFKVVTPMDIAILNENEKIKNLLALYGGKAYIKKS